jgi:hypothetical protein
MPRINPGLDYFPLDVDIDSDDKVELIEAKHGVVGFAVIIKLFMKIYRNSYYYEWGEKERLLFSKRLNVDINTLDAIIEDALEWEIFNRKIFDKWQILTSKGIQKRFLDATKRRQRVEIYAEYLLLGKNCLDEYNNALIVNIKADNADIITQRKGKESRGKERKGNAIDIHAVVDLYHSLCPSLPQVVKITDKRKRMVNARIRDNPDIKTFEALFKAAEASDFLTGRNGKWTGCNIDWLLNENNMVKVLEGNYSNKEPSKMGANAANALRLVEKYEKEGE